MFEARPDIEADLAAGAGRYDLKCCPEEVALETSSIQKDPEEVGRLLAVRRLRRQRACSQLASSSFLPRSGSQLHSGCQLFACPCKVWFEPSRREQKKTRVKKKKLDCTIRAK
jgi:hypothetical protein